MAELREIEVGANRADIERNRLVGAGLVGDPFPVYDRLRETGPVQRGSVMSAFGMPGGQLGSADQPEFSCYSWASADAVLRDNKTYSSRHYSRVLAPLVGESILQMDEPEHRRYRELAQPALTLGESERWRERWVEGYVERLVDGFIDRGRADLYTELCAHVPVHTVASSFGVAEADIPHFHEIAIAMLGGTSDPAERLAASKEIAEYLRRVIADRRKKPRDDLISVLCQAEMADPEDGTRQRLTDEEILAFARVMIPAGAGTTFRAMGTFWLAMLQRPELLAELRADRSLLGPAIEESLRWEQPLTAVSRLVVRETELEGVKIPEGAIMHACVAAANHDPARWDDPHRFDIHREPRPHMTFGSGPHLCLGMHLARMEIRVATTAVLDRLADLRLDPDAEEPFMTGVLFRMPTSVPVCFGRS